MFVCTKKGHHFAIHVTTSPYTMYGSFSKSFSCKRVVVKLTELFLITVQIVCIGTDRSQQTVQTKIRLLLKKQSDQGLRCLPFHQHLLDALMLCYIKLFYFETIMAIV